MLQRIMRMGMVEGWKLGNREFGLNLLWMREKGVGCDEVR